jgi:hypothetical protein
VEPRAPSGLFPSGPPRPTFREPHPVRVSAVLTGAGVAAAWMLLIGLLASGTRGYFWLTVTASLLASGGAALLVRFGDRGAAAGVAMATGVGLAVACGVVVQRWVTTGWPLW